MSHDSSACLKNVSVTIFLFPTHSPSNITSVFVGDSICHIVVQNATQMTCLALKRGSEPSLLSIMWQDGHHETLSANITCQRNFHIILRKTHFIVLILVCRSNSDNHSSPVPSWSSFGLDRSSWKLAKWSCCEGPSWLYEYGIFNKVCLCPELFFFRFCRFCSPFSWSQSRHECVAQLRWVQPPVIIHRNNR